MIGTLRIRVSSLNSNYLSWNKTASDLVLTAMVTSNHRGERNMITGCGCGALGAGMVLGAASMLSIGPNNLMLVREGLMRGRVGIVATLVLACNLVLLITAFFLTDAITAGLLPYRPALSWLGLVAVSWFAFLSLRASCTPVSERAEAYAQGETLNACLRRVLAIVWFNPLFYIELLLVPASISEEFKEPALRLQFILSLAIVVAISCYGYSFGAGWFARIIKQQRSLQIFDLASGMMLAGVALFMAMGLVAQ